jgi:pimeloyl-ACP methyl ester carboxylesterase
VTTLNCSGVELGWDRVGRGLPLVLVHGAWSNRRTWDPVFLPLSEHVTAIRYDRRGYGESQRPGTDPDTHTADLLSLIRTLGIDQVVLVGNSLGGLIAIQAALRASDVVRLVIAHEPPLLELLDSRPELGAVANRVRTALDRTLDAARSGNHRQAAQVFVEQMSSAPGTWEYLPPEMQQEYVENVEAFLAEAPARHQGMLSASALGGLGDRLVITRGDRSSLYLRSICDELCRLLPRAQAHVFRSAGHVPHQSVPADFVEKTLELVRAC